MFYNILVGFIFSIINQENVRDFVALGTTFTGKMFKFPLMVFEWFSKIYHVYYQCEN